jgi:hypothetical protein
METEKQPEQMREVRMPGDLMVEDGKTFWRRKADKVAFTDHTGRHRYEYVIECVEQSLLFRAIGRQYSAYAVWQALKCALVLETGLVHITQATLAKRSDMRPAQVSKAMALLRDADLVRDVGDDTADLRGMALNPVLVMIGDHGRARRLWERGIRVH